MTKAELIRTMGDIAGRFDLSAEQAERIAEAAVKAADPESEFVRIWKNEGWWQ